MRRRALAFGIVLTACAASARAQDAALEAELAMTMAQVVDLPHMPDEAAALETVPYRALVDRVRIGPDERTLVHLACAFSYAGLLESPGLYRGRVVFATGIVVQIARAEAPGVGHVDRDEAFAGVLGVLRPRGVQLWAFRALRRAGDGAVYVGDRVNLSGYFLKNVPMRDASAEIHRLPLVVCPWPTHVGFWPASEVRKFGAGVLPLEELPHEDVRRRPVADVSDDGGIAVCGTPLARADAAAILRRYTRRYPGRAVVARVRSDASRDHARSFLAEIGIAPDDVAWTTIGP